MQALLSFPTATILAIAFYGLMLSLTFPALRARIAPYLTHPAPPTQTYLYGFDAFRGIAALIVALGHSWTMNRPIFDLINKEPMNHLLGSAAKAVPMFAVLSGFLIYRSVLQIDSLVALRRYTLRRFFRIYPVYAVGTMLALVFGLYVAEEPKHTAFSYFVADLFMLYPLGWPKYAQAVAWSLYVEEMFYVLLPIIVVLFGRKRMVVFSLVGLAILLMAYHPSRTLGLWKYFLFGILASELEPHLKGRWPIAAICAVTGVALLLIDFRAAMTDFFGLLPDNASRSTYTLGVACMLILAALPNLGAVSRAISVLPLRMLGAISFSVFITHLFFIYYNFHNTLTISDSRQRFEANMAMPLLPEWFLPLVFIPAILSIGIVCFWTVERPGVLLGRKLSAKLQLAKGHQKQEVRDDGMSPTQFR